jgi:uncharacterized protein YkwD
MRTRGIPPIAAVALVAALFVTAPSAPAHASVKTERRNELLLLINRSRVHHGLRALRLSATTSDYAYRHSRQMCDADTLYHSVTLTARITSTTTATWWGENIAFGGSIRDIRKMWMHSAPHRANILNSHYRRAGVGVYYGRGSYWATVDFYG